MEHEQKLYMSTGYGLGCNLALIAASPESEATDCWCPPSIEHDVADVEESPTEARYPSRERRPPDWFRP